MSRAHARNRRAPSSVTADRTHFATDPVTIVAVVLLLAAVALAACVIPAVRATRVVDPMVALRWE